MLRGWSYLLAMMLLLAGPALAEEGPVDFARGAELALHLCSGCHDVTFDQSDAAGHEAPSFVSIANKPHQSAEWLTENILFPHRDMPQFSFEAPTDLRDVIGYIMSMRAQP